MVRRAPLRLQADVPSSEKSRWFECALEDTELVLVDAA
jgi:hypothetical protein